MSSVPVLSAFARHRPPKQYKAVNPMFSVISASTGLGAWFSGAATGIGLFAVVGAQSAFILRQGILRKHIVPVVATCAAIDAIFIFASVAGLRTLTSALPWLTTAVLWTGVAFLAWYAMKSARRAIAGGGGMGEADSDDGSRRAVVGNSVGGNMAAVVALMAKDKGGPAIRFQGLMWPVTDHNFNTGSYNAYQQGHFLTRPMMKWFWDAYTKNEAQRNEIYASPLRASTAQLKGLPPALIQVAQFDVLRDEGEAYGRKLDAAGVDATTTRYDGTINDFGLLNALAGDASTKAATKAMANELATRLK